MSKTLKNLKMSFAKTRGNDSKSADYHSMLKK